MRGRLLHLIRRTGMGGNLRDSCPLEDRASAHGVSLKADPGTESSTRNANKMRVSDKELAYLRARTVLPFPPKEPPADTPGDLTHGVRCALEFGRNLAQFSVGKCELPHESRLSPNLVRAGAPGQAFALSQGQKGVVYREYRRDPSSARRCAGRTLRRPALTVGTHVSREAIGRPAGIVRGDTSPCARMD